MDDREDISRRLFMIKSCAGLGSAWIVSHLPEIAAAQEHAHHAALSQATPRFEFFTPEERAVLVEGLNDLQKKARKRFGKTKRFSDLSSGQQTELLKRIEKGQFFELVRTMTILGMFSNPEYGGN